MNHLKSTIAGVSFTLLATPVLADVTANIGVTSDYLWRGASQSGGSASVSGGLDYSDESGFYAGAWVGSLGDGTSAETDLYFGYGGDINESLSYDVGYIAYIYSQQDDADFSEIYASLSCGAYTVGAAYTVDGDAADTAAFIEGDSYIYASAGFDLTESVSLGLTVGDYSFDAAAAEDYTHYQADIGKGDFTLTVSDSDAADSDTIVAVSWGIEI